MGRDDHTTWVEVLRDSKPNQRQISLFGTPATILWKDGDPEVIVVCITQFANGVPKTRKYDNFPYDIEKRYWTVNVPRGAAAVLVAELEQLFGGSRGA
jgi:hypothetical protein